jgi:lysozyme family protein
MGIFSSCIQYVLDNEGGYTNDPNDSGGPTNFGITQEDLAEWYKRPVSAAEVQSMSVKTAEQIYFFNYWNPLNLGQIPSNNICTCILDTGVNQGTGTAARFAQKASNACGITPILNVDGMLGDFSMANINACNVNDFIDAYVTSVLARYQEIVTQHPTQQVFMNGWTNRANRLLSLKTT